MQPSTNTRMVGVIAAVVDDKQLTLYKEDGETLFILQGDPRLARIIQTITPILVGGPGAVAQVDLGEDESVSPYRAYEEQSNGVVSFFRIAKTKLASWLSLKAEPTLVPPQVIGQIPTTNAEGAVEKALSAIKEIITHAQPVSAADFHDKDVSEKGESTMIAVVDNKVISGMEKLKPQLERAVAAKSSVAMNAFMTRIAAVSDHRRHSVEDLLKFLEKGDLPISDDGCIIIYKVLRRAGSDRYVDYHSGLVSQRIGSYVCMDPSLVDPNRHQECSNGLHVARRQYLSSFSGDVVVLAKVKPEDVIAVPLHDPNKMRVCGYHILFELSSAAYFLLKNNKPFTDNSESQLLLGRALSGDHDEPLEEVRIHGQLGTGVKITPWVTLKAKPEAEKIIKPIKPVEALPESEIDSALSAAKVDPKAVQKELNKAKAAVETRKDKAIRLHKKFVTAKSESNRRNAAKDLLAHKRASKLGWSVLGLPADIEESLSLTLHK